MHPRLDGERGGALAEACILHECIDVERKSLFKMTHTFNALVQMNEAHGRKRKALIADDLQVKRCGDHERVGEGNSATGAPTDEVRVVIKVFGRDPNLLDGESKCRKVWRPKTQRTRRGGEHQRERRGQFWQ